jgi:hypothetical protein
MSSSKKSTSSNKQSANLAEGSALSNGSKKQSNHDRELINTGTDKRYVRRDSKTGQFVEQANKHMERAWGKIYDRSERTGASKR